MQADCLACEGDGAAHQTHQTCLIVFSGTPIMSTNLMAAPLRADIQSLIHIHTDD